MYDKDQNWIAQKRLLKIVLFNQNTNVKRSFWFPAKKNVPKITDLPLQVRNSQREAQRDGVVVPTTVEDYCVQTRRSDGDADNAIDIEEFYDDEMECNDDDDEANTMDTDTE